MSRRERRSAGYTLVELLIVITLIGIIAGLALPDTNPGIYDRLYTTAEIIAADVAYCRSLAVMNNSTYRLSLERDENRYVIRHTGPVSALDTLPDSPFRDPLDPPDAHVVDLDDLPVMGTPVAVASMHTDEATPQAVTDLEFNPLGETTRAEETVIWLTAGASAAQRFIALRINPITGLVTIDSFQNAPPPLFAAAVVP